MLIHVADVAVEVPNKSLDLSKVIICTCDTQSLQVQFRGLLEGLKWLDLQKPALMAQELKYNLQPNINDTLMHCVETSIA